MSFNKIKNIGIASLLAASLVACNDNNKTINEVQEKQVEEPNFPNEGKIAYVNIDSLEANYLYLKDKQKELERKQNQIQNELQSMNTQFQNKLSNMQKKYQAGTLTADEAEKTEKELASMQERFEKRQISAQNEMLTLQESLMRDLQDRLNTFIAKYNEDKKYAYVLSYGEGGSILFADPKYDITDDVIQGMNAEGEKEDKKESKDE